MIVVTNWTCENCRAEGSVAHENDTDLWSVFHKIKDAHRLASPTCRFLPGKVRVTNTHRV